MGKFRTKQLVLSALVVALVSPIASAQVSTTPLPPLGGDAAVLSAALPSQEPGVIDFENVEGQQIGAGIALSDQYSKSHGVTFGRGASVHFCARVFDDVNASLCPYPQAASGRRAAAHDVRSGGPAMVMDFSRDVSAVSMRINPTGGVIDEVFVAELAGFDANGERVANASVEFNWRQDAFTWPTSAALRGARFSRLTVSLRRVAQNNQPVRFLIDDLVLQYASDETASPVAAAIADQKGPPRARGAVIVQSTEVGGAQDEMRLYPAATRKRTTIDWDAVEKALGEQKDMDLAATPYRGERFVAAAELPLLLPASADPGSVIVLGNRDSVNAHFTLGGAAYSLYGSRLLTVIGKNEGAPGVGDAVAFTGTEQSLVASFSVYGAAYALTRHCKDESVTADPACHDRDALGKVAADLVVAVGEAGRARP